MSARFDFPNFIGLLFIIAAIALWAQAAFAFLNIELVNFLIYTILGFIVSILGGYLLKPHNPR